jgi:hypothetical protein
VRFSGHESFACRYAWLPKAYRALAHDPLVLADEEQAMVELGVGKNMVRSIRFWIVVMGIATTQRGRGYELTPFGQAILADQGYDPFLEDVRTLWLLHWNVSTHADDPVFAWRFLLNEWAQAELSASEVVTAFKRESQRLGLRLSDVTLAQHFEVFLHTYVSKRHAEVSSEDSLDGPLVELALLQYVGDRRTGNAGRREAVYAFRREPKPEISTAVFEYCLDDYWKQWHPAEATLTYRNVAVAPGSVGQVFKLPEDDIRTRLDTYVSPKRGALFQYQPSAVQGLVSRRRAASDYDFLSAVYATDRPYA